MRARSRVSSASTSTMHQLSGAPITTSPRPMGIHTRSTSHAEPCRHALSTVGRARAGVPAQRGSDPVQSRPRQSLSFFKLACRCPGFSPRDWPCHLRRGFRRWLLGTCRPADHPRHDNLGGGRRHGGLDHAQGGTRRANQVLHHVRLERRRNPAHQLGGEQS